MRTTLLRRGRRTAVAGATLLLPLSFVLAPAQDAGAGNAIPWHAATLDDEVIAVQLADGVSTENLRSAAATAGLRIDNWGSNEGGGWHRVRPSGTAGVLGDRVAALAAVPGVEFASPLLRGSGEHWAAVTPGILVRFVSADAALAASTFAELGVDVEIVSAGFRGILPGAYELRCPTRNAFEVLALVKRLAADPRVRWAEPDLRFTGSSAYLPNDPGFANLWGIRNTGQFGGTIDMDINGDAAWEETFGAPSVPVLVLETGIQRDHPDLNVADGVDFSLQGLDGAPMNRCDNHGTAVAGCISAVIDNSLGTVGVSPLSPVLSARAFVANVPCDGGWWTYGSWTVNSLAWGFVSGARVSNNSNGYGFTFQAIDDAYASTHDGAMVHFAAAGNEGSPGVNYPASIEVVLAISAIDPTGSLASFSNYGADVDYCAPGQAIYTTDRSGPDGWDAGDYLFVQGTSFASPYAAGVAALITAHNPTLSAMEVETLLRDGARDLGATGFDNTYAWGLLDAAASLALSPGAGLDVDDVAAGGNLDVLHYSLRPNPSAGATVVSFALAQVGPVRIDVFDVGGRHVRTLPVSGSFTGLQEVEWDGRDAHGGAVAEGIYFVRLQTAQQTLTKKLAFLR